MKALYATGTNLISEERFYKLLKWQAFNNYCKQLRGLALEKDKKQKDDAESQFNSFARFLDSLEKGLGEPTNYSHFFS